MSPLAEYQAGTPQRAKMPIRRVVFGYVVCAALGGAYVSFWFRHGIMPDEDFGAWEGVFKNLWLFVPMALVCCLPAFATLRRLLYKSKWETTLNFVLVCAASGSSVFLMFSLRLMNDVSALVSMVVLTTVPGAVIGLIYYCIEQPKRTAKA